MEKQVTFHDLATHLRMLLESESYSQTTVKDMDFILILHAGNICR